MVSPNALSSAGDLLVRTSIATPAVQVYDPWVAEIIEHHAVAFASHALRLGGDLASIDPLAGVGPRRRSARP